MNPPPAPPADANAEIAELIRSLLATERRLVELTAGEVDSVSDGESRTFLLSRAQEQLRLAEAVRQEAIINALPAHIALLDSQGRIVSVNEAWRQFSGANTNQSPGPGVGLDYLAVCDRARGEGAEDARRVAENIRAVLSGRERGFSLEYPCHSPAKQRWFLMTVTPLAEGGAKGAVVMHLDITERKVAELAAARLATIVESSDDAIIGKDMNGVITSWNKGAEKIFGYTAAEMTGVSIMRLIPPERHDDETHILANIRGEKSVEHYETLRLTKSGRLIHVSVTASPIKDAKGRIVGVAKVARDISGRKRLEDQVREAQKMEAIGTLAGGIAHDFNNILAAINGYTELSCMQLTGNPDVRAHLDTVLKATDRATVLVRQILTFSRQQKAERRPVELLPVVAESLMLLRATIPSTIEFETSLPTDAPTVLADSTQVHQILMNLGTNAWHAMKDGPGRLKISLERCVVDAALASTQSRLRPGIYARISVADTGGGMDPATLQRIFEPFFTTKPLDEGTGLGLAVVHGIMDSHEGAITVRSRPGEGTVFQLYFPAHVGDATLAASTENPVPRGRGERILFVDDEELLVELGRESLLALGYEVEICRRPEEALALVRADPGRFALVITDQTMPRMTGLVLAGQLRQIRPDLPIILTTGYSQSLTPEGVQAAGLRRLLLKPFSFHSLGTCVHEALSPSIQAGTLLRSKPLD